MFAKVGKGPAKTGFRVMQLLFKDCEIKIAFSSLLYKTNRFHVAVRLFSNTSQVTPRLVITDDRLVAHEAIAECVTDVLTTF